ncbi:MAG: ComEA family DNA-binding protein [Anaerolineaceae bacterium]|nr:ComEA family DNA-binding protein [Anaerolineaceae bacterium]
MKNAFFVLIGVMGGFILAGALFFIARAPSGEPIVLQPAPTESPIAIHVIGAVVRPGLYELPENARVQDAIDAAGGLLAAADESGLNLAALLEDGQQLNIPYASGSEPDERVNALDLPSSEDSGLEDSLPSSDLVDINTATLEELDALPGIGPTTAQKIIDYRAENGPFSVIEDIMNVSGIGPATFEGIKELITVENAF